jgi:hypothetical protein
LINLDNTSKKNIQSLEKSDFTIVGAGAAGILLATKLSKKGFKVHLIESGGLNINKEAQNKIVSDNKKIKDSAINGRKRVVGGTTTKWGGQSLPFEKIDFLYRDWINSSGWPITYEEVNSFYNEANHFMGIDQYGYGESLLKKLNFKNPFFNTTEVEYRLSKWAPEPNFYKKYKSEIRSNYITIYNAMVTSINFSKDKLVSSIKLKNTKKQEYQIKVNNLIIACGGIESTRLLLLNMPEKPINLGVGFMEHLHINIGCISTSNLFSFQRLFNTKFHNLRKLTARIMVSEELQKEEKLVNCSALFDFLSINELNAKSKLYSLLKRIRLKSNDNNYKDPISSFNIMKLLQIIISLTKSAFSLIFYRFYYAPDNSKINLNVIAEQIPDNQNTITLAVEKDLHGNKLAEIKWIIPEISWKSIVVFSNKLKYHLESIDGVEVTLNKEIVIENLEYAKYIDPIYHHMGGCKMSEKPNKGVVNRDLQVWGHPNLYVCSSAVFPTSSHSNPTLTILALACRLANNLSKYKSKK